MKPFNHWRDEKALKCKPSLQPMRIIFAHVYNIEHMSLQSQKEWTLDTRDTFYGEIEAKKGQSQVLEQLHHRHPGMSRMKGLARSIVWWPGIDTDIIFHKCKNVSNARRINNHLHCHHYNLYIVIGPVWLCINFIIKFLLNTYIYPH